MFKVELAHTANPDVDGGYWQQPVDAKRRVKREVASLHDAAKVCREYIERNGLGGGNWIGGKVTDSKGAFVARVSYNGRVWDSMDWQTQKEISI